MLDFMSKKSIIYKVVNYIKNEFKSMIIDVKKENCNANFENKPIIFFDICNTLGKVETITEKNQKKIDRNDLYLNFCKRNDICVNKTDFFHLNENSLFYLNKLIKETNSIGVCISSWNKSLKVRNKNKNVVKILNMIFKEIEPTWSLSNIQFAFNGLNPNNRCFELEKFLKVQNINNSYIVIDDANEFIEYNKNGLLIDGKKGFIKKDYLNAIDLLMTNIKVQN